MPQNVRTRVATAAMFAAGMLLAVVSVACAGLTPEQKCQKGRYAAAAKYAQCETNAFGQLFATNDLAKLQPALSKCRIKYVATWPKLRKSALGTGSTCDQNRFSANNVMVKDVLTGLEWEMQTDDGTEYDKDNVYVWALAYGIFLREVNTTFVFPFAWRLPTVAELQTILLPEPYPCKTSPCIDPIFGPTVAADYWSSTTLADNQLYAWGVFFGNAPVNAVSYGVENSVENHVRAVRGGL